jgi:hypothetical protein
MKNIKWMAAAAITTLTAGALSAITASPAQAVGTAMTLTLTGGALEISAPATADLGSATAVAANNPNTSPSQKRFEESWPSISNAVSPVVKSPKLRMN